MRSGIEKAAKGGTVVKKLKEWIETWLDGKQVRGIKNITPVTIYELVDIYNAVVRKEEFCFINGKTKEILDKCGIKSIPDGIGWKIV